MPKTQKRQFPVQYPCVKCYTECDTNSILCCSCDRWEHSQCVPMSEKSLAAWSRRDMQFYCPDCCIVNGQFDFGQSLPRLKTAIQSEKAIVEAENEQLLMTQQREKLFHNFVTFQIRDKGTVTSTDGQSTFKRPKTLGKKPGQRKRKNRKDSNKNKKTDVSLRRRFTLGPTDVKNFKATERLEPGSTTTTGSENCGRDESLVIDDLWERALKERDGSAVMSKMGIIPLGACDKLLQVERRSFVVAAILMSITIFVLVFVTIIVHYKHGGGYYNYEVVPTEIHKEQSKQFMLKKTDTNFSTE